MLKALFKKQMLEISALFLRNRKTGETRRGPKAVGYLLLYGLVFLSVAVIFFIVGNSLASQLVPLGYGQLYFAIMSLIAVAFGVIGSVFNTYAGLYLAKDNELLLSMPIPPSRILLARLTSVALLGLLYQSLVWIPAMICYWIAAGFSFLSCVLQLLTGFFLAMIVTALTCFLGWIVALISGKLKNKSFLTVLLFLVFIAGYYILYGNAYRILGSILSNADAVGSGVKSFAYPFWKAGEASVGDFVSLLIFSAIAVAALAVTWILMERSFLRIATANRGTAKTVYRQKAVKQGSVRSALFRKELKRFTSSATYMLNCGLGTVFVLAAAVALLIYAGKIRGAFDLLAQSDGDFRMVMPYLPHFAAVALCFLATMNDITAPSVSMEGRSLWVVRSFPVRAWDALAAKLQLHVVLTLTPLCAAGIVCSAVLGLSIPASLLVLAAGAAFTVFSAAAGLALNLLQPNLNWTNETVPLKQSMPVFVMIFGSWGLIALLAAAVFAASLFLPPLASLAVGVLLLVLFSALLLLWLYKKGTKIFDNLG